MPTLDPSFNLDLWYALGILFEVFLFIYVIFSLIIVRQIHLMTNTLNGSLDPFIKSFGMIHFIFSIAVFILGWIVLL